LDCLPKAQNDVTINLAVAAASDARRSQQRMIAKKAHAVKGGGGLVVYQFDFL
jgi:hypothetical protein